MKLELKHIVGYLPYGLEIEWQRCIYPRRKENIKLHVTDLVLWDNKSFKLKPILRPLSDLVIEIEIDETKFTPIIELLKIKYKSYYDEKLGSRYSLIEIKNCPNYAEAYFEYHAPFSIQVWYNSLQKEPHWIIEKLYEWHFDIHNLIENNLAIDINTLK